MSEQGHGRAEAGEVIDPNIVEVYVRHLGNKVDRPFGRDSVRTIRGSGYRLDADGG